MADQYDALIKALVEHFNTTLCHSTLTEGMSRADVLKCVLVSVHCVAEAQLDSHGSFTLCELVQWMEETWREVHVCIGHPETNLDETLQELRDQATSNYLKEHRN